MATLQCKSCGPYLSASAMKFMKRRYTNVRPLPLPFFRRLVKNKTSLKHQNRLRLSTPQAIMRTSLKVKGKGQGHQANIMLRPEVNQFKDKGQRSRPTNAHTVNAQYFRTGRPTKFKLGKQTKHEDPHHSPFKVKGQGRKVTWCVWHVLADKLRTNRPRNTKIGRKVVHPKGNNAHQFQGQMQRSRSPGRHNVETESASYLPSCPQI